MTTIAWAPPGRWPVAIRAFDRWHITSTDIHEASFPLLNSVISRGFTYAVAFHGFDDPEIPFDILIGGAAPYSLKQEIDTAVFGVGMLVFFVNMILALIRKAPAGANPWGRGATTLEWTLPSPPPFHQFSTLPRVVGPRLGEATVETSETPIVESPSLEPGPSPEHHHGHRR
jgi:hypothetical protein